MRAYIDSSVLLRLVLGQPGRLNEWRTVKTAVCSGLVEVECLRTLDRLRLASALSDEELVVRRETVYRLIEEMEVVEITPTVLRRASQPQPTPLGTLDALHLATALLWIESRNDDLVMATHDHALGTAARANGLRVIGLQKNPAIRKEPDAGR